MPDLRDPADPRISTFERDSEDPRDEVGNISAELNDVEQNASVESMINGSYKPGDEVFRGLDLRRQGSHKRRFSNAKFELGR